MPYKNKEDKAEWLKMYRNSNKGKKYHKIYNKKHYVDWYNNGGKEVRKEWLKKNQDYCKRKHRRHVLLLRGIRKTGTHSEQEWEQLKKESFLHETILFQYLKVG